MNDFIFFCFSILSSFLLCVYITIVITNKAITKIDAVLLNYFEDRGQKKEFFGDSKLFYLKKKVLPVHIYLVPAFCTARSSHFFLEIIII